MSSTSERRDRSFDPRPETAPALRVQMLSGRVLDLSRPRWKGVLDAEELEYCTEHDVPLGYDAAQGGWVVLSSLDQAASESSAAADDDQAGVQAAERPAITLRETVEIEANRISTALRDGGGAVDEAEQLLTELVDASVAAVADERGLVEAFFFRLALEPRVVRALSAAPDRRPAPSRGADDTLITFRSWTLEDADTYLRLLGNPRVWTHLPEPYPEEFTVDTARSLIEVGNIGFHHETVAIEVEGRLVGQCLLRFDQPGAETRTAEVAYWLGEDHWGQGLMSRALPVFTRRSFQSHPLDVIHAWIMPENLASRRAAERAGYRRASFAREPEVAEALHRPGFICYVTYRTDWELDTPEG